MRKLKLLWWVFIYSRDTNLAQINFNSKNVDYYAFFDLSWEKGIKYEKYKSFMRAMLKIEQISSKGLLSKIKQLEIINTLSVVLN